MKITCTVCFSEIEREEGPLEGDFSIFVCEGCQEKRNLPAYEEELESLKSLENPTPQIQDRINFLEERIKSIK